MRIWVANSAWRRRVVGYGIAAMVIWVIGSLAMPNTICSTERSMISRVKADQRSLATALESYYVDYEAYPVGRLLRAGGFHAVQLKKSGGWGLMQIETGRIGRVGGLTTPVSYITSIFTDPFTGDANDDPRSAATRWPFAYYRSPDNQGWMVWSPGPDRDYDITNPAAVYDPTKPVPGDGLIAVTYDPTNGLKSGGDIYRTCEGVK